MQNLRTCMTCGKAIVGDANYCRKHYYEHLKADRLHVDKARMVVSEWETMPDGVLRRTITNAA